MEVLRTVALDIQHTVFNNDTVGILYLTKDIHDDSYIISLPIFSFSARIRETHVETDCEWIYENIPSMGKKYREKLIEVIKQTIENFY